MSLLPTSCSAAILNSTLAVAGNTTIGGTLLVNNVNVVSAINGKQDTLSSSAPLSCSTLSASSTVSLSGGGDFGGPLLRMYSSANQGSAIEFGTLGGNSRAFHIQQAGSTLQFWRSLYNTKSFEVTNSAHVSFFSGFSNASDQRIKTPNPPAASTEDSIAMVKAVQARTYKRLDLPDTELSRIRFVAQEVEAACPSAWGNLISTAQYSINPGEAETEIKCLDYGRLTSVLWTVTRSLLARVEALEARVPQGKRHGHGGRPNTVLLATKG